MREAKVASEPEALAAFFAELDVEIARIALEAGPLSQWLHDGLDEAGLPVVCAETRHLQAVLSAAANKSDRNDARGIAQMVRTGLIRPVHVKTVASQEKRMLLAYLRFMLRQLCETEAIIRGILRNFGLKLGKVGGSCSSSSCASSARSARRCATAGRAWIRWRPASRRSSTARSRCRISRPPSNACATATCSARSWRGSEPGGAEGKSGKGGTICSETGPAGRSAAHAGANGGGIAVPGRSRGRSLDLSPADEQNSLRPRPQEPAPP